MKLGVVLGEFRVSGGFSSIGSITPVLFLSLAHKICIKKKEWHFYFGLHESIDQETKNQLLSLAKFREKRRM